MPNVSELEARLESRSALAGVVGLGYAGLPLAVEVARAGFGVIGIDTDPDRISQINHGHSYVPDIEGRVLLEAVSSDGCGPAGTMRRSRRAMQFRFAFRPPCERHATPI